MARETGPAGSTGRTRCEPPSQQLLGWTGTPWMRLRRSPVGLPSLFANRDGDPTGGPLRRLKELNDRHVGLNVSGFLNYVREAQGDYGSGVLKRYPLR